MNDYFSTPFTLGILGGGQLGKMLLYETRKWDLKTHVLDPSQEAPARLACNHFQQGDLMDYDTVFQFGKQVDLLTVEIETVNVDALEALEKKGVNVYPSANTLRVIQNKGDQKDFYKKHQLPTAAYSRFRSIQELQNQQPELPFVWKSCTGGYDGNGVQIIREASQIAQLPEGPCITEKMIPFKHELAVIVARTPGGKISTYPVVEMEFHPEANQVEYVICPARISEEVAKKAREVATQVSEAMDHVGLLAVELFQTEDDQILINEVAPRPHNSGHYSIEASYTTQFEQHLRAILDLPLGKTDSKTAAVMVNLVGDEQHQGPVRYQNIERILGMNGVTPHIYGKSQTRPFRKMGHVTIIDQDVAVARAVAAEVKKTIKVISQ
ncbi:5-(carboxyamino)imidazole ribonucleotide synthase [Croceiramulus getboli]|nr:5-(carboxyamino)imidazole ribonucleotide synthase [Flavobacteriaceae bacterium YJPT1-3]